MSHKDFSVLLSAFFMFAGSAWYIRQVVRQEVHAVLAAWVVLGGTLSLSLFTYLTTPSPSLISNIGTVVSMGSGVAILTVVAFLSWKRGEILELNGKQKASLACASTIALFWAIDVWALHDRSIVPNLLTQALMLIGYFLNLSTLATRKRNTDSFQLWTGICISGICALDVAMIAGDTLAFISSFRGIICSGITIYVMCRIEVKSRLAIA